MAQYSSRQVREILGLSAAIVSRLIEAGFVKPARGPRREYRFSFQDLVVLRAAKGLADARLPPRRIARSLKKLRAQLPAELPAAGLHIAAVGNSLAVMESRGAWRADDGQYLMAFEVAAPQGQVVILDSSGRDSTHPDEHPDETHHSAEAKSDQTKSDETQSADHWFDAGCLVEDSDSERAIGLYRKALAAKFCHAGVFSNLGRLLHEKGKLVEANAVYRDGVAACPNDPLLLFNFAVLCDEQGRRDAAVALYRKALLHDPGLADAHYNLGLLFDAAGKPREALRHFSAYRKLARSGV